MRKSQIHCLRPGLLSITYHLPGHLLPPRCRPAPATVCRSVISVLLLLVLEKPCVGSQYAHGRATPGWATLGLTLKREA